MEWGLLPSEISKPVRFVAKCAKYAPDKLDRILLDIQHVTRHANNKTREP
jgi:hypothetical protein